MLASMPQHSDLRSGAARTHLRVKSSNSLAACAFADLLALTSEPKRRTLCDPYLNLFRGLIPPLGGTIDLSPILAFIVLDVRFPHFPGSTHLLGGLP